MPKQSLHSFLKAQTKTAYDPLLQAQAQPLWEALAGKVRGTEYEAMVVDADWAMSTTGADPSGPISGSTLDAASPFRNLDPGRMELWRAQINAKLAAKGCDLVIANDVSAPDAGFAVDTNRVIAVDAAGATELPFGSKAAVAHRILDAVAPRLR